MSGRKKDIIWNNFNEIKEIGKSGYKAECKKCGKIFQGIVKRMIKHKTECESNVNDSTSSIEFLELDSASTSTGRKTTNDNTEVVRKSSVNKQNSVAKFVKSTKTSKEDKARCDEQTARYIFSTNASFLTVDHKEFIGLCQTLRPGYNPPNRQTITDKWLDIIHDKEQQKCKENLKNQTVCLSLDGWSNRRNEPIICACIITDKGHVTLVDTVDTSGKLINK